MKILIIPLMITLASLCSCDWAHHVQYQIRPAPIDEVFTSAVATVALETSFVPGSGFLVQNCPLGAYIEKSTTNSARAIWICAGRFEDVAVIDLREFNRGTPWRPSDEFEAVQKDITKKLNMSFPSSLKVVTKPEMQIQIEAVKP